MTRRLEELRERPDLAHEIAVEWLSRTFAVERAAAEDMLEAAVFEAGELKMTYRAKLPLIMNHVNLKVAHGRA